MSTKVSDWRIFWHIPLDNVKALLPIHLLGSLQKLAIIKKKTQNSIEHIFLLNLDSNLTFAQLIKIKTTYNIRFIISVKTASGNVFIDSLIACFRSLWLKNDTLTFTTTHKSIFELCQTLKFLEFFSTMTPFIKQLILEYEITKNEVKHFTGSPI